MKTTITAGPKQSTATSVAPEVKRLHAQNREITISGLMDMPVRQLINELIVEKDCKNLAYYFILENGHYDQYKAYLQSFNS